MSYLSLRSGPSEKKKGKRKREAKKTNKRKHGSDVRVRWRERILGLTKTKRTTDGRAIVSFLLLFVVLFLLPRPSPSVCCPTARRDEWTHSVHYGRHLNHPEPRRRRYLNERREKKKQTKQKQNHTEETEQKRKKKKKKKKRRAKNEAKNSKTKWLLDEEETRLTR